MTMTLSVLKEYQDIFQDWSGMKPHYITKGLPSFSIHI